MFRSIRRVLLFLFCIFGWAAKAQQQETMPFYRVGTFQGLSQSTVFCMYQDRQGFLWFGTAEGLNRYDGYSFKVYRHVLNDSTSLASNEIIAINEDDQGNIWVGTRTAGLSILNVHTQLFANNTKPMHLGKGSVNVILNDKQGNMWLHSSTLGLVKINNATQKLEILKPRAKAELGISCAKVISNGNILLGTERFEILRFQHSKYIGAINIPHISGLGNGYISGIEMLNAQSLVVSTSSDGLFVVDWPSGQSKSIFYKKGTLGGVNNIKAVLKNAENKILAPTDNGLLVFDPNNWPKYAFHEANSLRRFALSTKALLSILIDKNQNTWLGTWEGGLNVNYQKEPPFKLLRQETGQLNGPLERKITSVAAQGSHIWIGSNSGLSHFERQKNTWTHLGASQLSGADINALRIDGSGHLFVSPYQGNLSIILAKTQQIKQYNFKKVRTNALASMSTFCPAANGKMWIGTNSSGVYLFDKNTGKFDPLKNRFTKLNVNGVTAILEDKNKQLWIGTNAYGLYKVDLQKGKILQFLANKNVANSLGDNHILSLAQDAKGAVWVGTNGAGLCLFDATHENFKGFSAIDGLPNNTIKSIVEDKAGILWLSTNLGLCSFDPATKHVKKYTEADGIQGKEFGRNVGAKNEYGELFFGGTNGLSYFLPSQLKTPQSQIPKIVFTDFKVFNKPVSLSDKNSPIKTDITLAKTISLKYDQAMFTIDFSALDFQQLKNYQYAYMLEGFDKTWNEIGTQRSASYTNMHEGSYVFKVRSTDNYGQWVNNEANIQIYISPPWYRSLWAYLMYTFCLGLALYVWRRIIIVREKLQTDARIQRIEAKKIKELDLAKTNFFTNISHEFRTPLTLIISPLQQIMHEVNQNISWQDMQQKHSLILKNAQRLLRLINQILDVSKLEAGSMKLQVSKSDVVEFLNAIAIGVGPLAKAKNIHFVVNIHCKLRYVFFDKDILEKITYNLLSNAFKFCPEGGKVVLEAFLQEKVLFVHVKDNGEGIGNEAIAHVFDRFYQDESHRSSQRIGTGIGLALSKELATLHKGHLDVESTLGQGSVFTLSIPVSYDSFDPIQVRESFSADTPLIENSFEQAPFSSTEILLEANASTLLVVEDNDELREYLASLFDKKYKVLLAKDGQEGLDIAIAQIPDLISDLMMPQLDGSQLCQAIKTDERCSHIPFIMLTSKQAVASVNASFENGADDYIIKPFDSNILLKKVQNILATRMRLLKKREAIVPNATSAIQSPDERFMLKINQIIAQNIHDAAFDVSSLEEQLSMSKMQLYRKLRAICNKAPIEIIKQVRLEKAVQLFRESNLNISEVSYAIGYNDPAYFAKVFKKEYGKAPSDFLKGGD
jgi:signal transduction histidine kinase/ligand-binding sensor domain-containing protein/DNA-binding response OmpR family regulator